jgi:hypothetical protein
MHIVWERMGSIVGAYRHSWLIGPCAHCFRFPDQSSRNDVVTGDLSDGLEVFRRDGTRPQPVRRTCAGHARDVLLEARHVDWVVGT